MPADGDLPPGDHPDVSCSRHDADAADALIERLATERKKRGDFIAAETVFVALFPLIYGVLTFAYSNALWNPSGVHAAALKVPGAPESWGLTFIITAGAVIVCGLRHWNKALFVWCLGSAFVYAVFMTIVFMAQDAYPRTLGQAAVYGVFSLLFLNRARLAWVT